MIFVIQCSLTVHGSTLAVQTFDSVCFPTSSYAVQQTPPSLIRSPGQSVPSQIYCSHSITNFDNILWYKQDSGGALKYLGYLNLQFPYPENDVKETLSFSGDGRSHSNLSFSGLSEVDSAVYFCAARRAQCSGASRWQCKNPADGAKHLRPRPTIQKPPKRQPSCCHCIPDSAPLQLHSNQLWSDCNQRLMGRVSPTGALTVKDLQPDDAGLYFCAVSKHSDAKRQKG
uniref:Ig-like domain-containing protein n=1 Tax=Oryzias sinensis TaxID=183150 RepID=A0A8C7X3P4_9TELE